MAIVKMSKFQLFTFAKDQEKLLKKLQEFNYVHLLDPEAKEEAVLETEAEEEKSEKGKTTSRAVLAINEEIEKVKTALKLLSNYDVRPGGLKKLREGPATIAFSELEDRVAKSDWETTFDKVKEVSDHLEELSHQETKIRADLEEVGHWADLDVSPRSLDNLKLAQGQLGSVPKKLAVEFEAALRRLNTVSYRLVGGTKTENWYAIFNHPSEEEALQESLRQFAFSQLRPDFDEVPLDRKKRLNEELIKLKALQKETKDELAKYGSALPDLEMAYEYLENKKLRLEAQDQFNETAYTRLAQGFVPTEKAGEFEATIQAAVGDNYNLAMAEADKEDPEVPIILKNSKFNDAFQNITEMYALPRYDELDPTPIMAPFYLFFFGMMMGDFGYGLVMLLGSYFALKKLKLKKSMKNFARFFFYLSWPTIFWGLIYGSFFSLELGLPRLLNPAEDFMTILVISVIIGLFHLFFGLAVKAYMLIRDGKPLDAVIDVGLWYMALTGGLVFLLSGMLNFPPWAKTAAMVVMAIGMVGIVLFTAREAAGWGGRIAGGLYNLYGISSWIGDLVSYSRLMALGLSSAFIGQAFNMIAGMIGNAWYLIPIALAFFLVGHGFNLFLGLLSAYVHSLRLIYVEYFGKFYEGGGKAFKKLKKDPKYIEYSDAETY